MKEKKGKFAEFFLHENFLQDKKALVFQFRSYLDFPYAVAMLHNGARSTYCNLFVV